MESIVLALGRKLLPSFLYERVASSSIARRLARGSLWSLFGSATARVLVLVAMILVARVLGQVSFGELGLIQSTLGMTGLMAGMGLGETATRFVAKYATSDPLRAGRVIALVTSVSIGTVLLAAVVLISVSGLIAGAVLNSFASFRTRCHGVGNCVFSFVCDSCWRVNRVGLRRVSQVSGGDRLWRNG
jgi:hypothetical protein